MNNESNPECGKCKMLGDAAPCDECYNKSLVPQNKAVSITDKEIEKKGFDIFGYGVDIQNTGKDNFINAAKWARDEMLKRNVISIQRDKLKEIIDKTEESLVYENIDRGKWIDAIADAILQSGSIREDKPFDREKLIEMVNDFSNTCFKAHKEDFIPDCEVFVNALTARLSSHLKEGEQRKPLKFQEWFFKYCPIPDWNNLMVEERAIWKHKFEGYLTNFK